MTSKGAEGSINEQSATGGTGTNPDDLRILEALLFASDELMTAARLKTILPNNPDARKIRAMVEKINVQLQKERHPFEIVEIGGGYQFRTITYYHPWVRQIFKEKSVKKLSVQALECLAIIAYKQPLSKAEIEAIRGVVSDGAMKTLLEKRLVTIAGRSEKPGRPLLYATTQSFLKYFGLNKIDDLPRIEEFESIAREKMEDMSIDELSEPESEMDTSGKDTESEIDTGEDRMREKTEPDLETAGETDSSIFEVSVEESVAEEAIGPGEHEAASEEAEDADDDASETVAFAENDEDVVDESRVTDKTQAIVRENVIPPVTHEHKLVKSADDLQNVDMGKTKAYSDSVFDLALPEDVQTEVAGDIPVEEAETIAIKMIDDESVEAPDENNDGQESGNEKIGSESEEVVVEKTGASESGEQTAREEEDIFDLEALSEVKPEEKNAVDKESKQDAVNVRSEAVKIPEPEESSFTIEVNVDESELSIRDNDEDEEVSFEVKHSGAEDHSEKETSKEHENAAGTNKNSSVKKEKDGKKKGK